VAVNHPEFNLTGLKVTSTIRLDKVCTLLKELVVGEIEEIGDMLRLEVNKTIIELYRF